MGLKTTFPDLPSHSTTLLCKVSKSYEIDLSSYLAQQCGDSCLINYASYLIGVVGTSLLISIQLSTDFPVVSFRALANTSWLLSLHFLMYRYQNIQRTIATERPDEDSSNQSCEQIPDGGGGGGGSDSEAESSQSSLGIGGGDSEHWRWHVTAVTVVCAGQVLTLPHGLATWSTERRAKKYGQTRWRI